MRCSRRHSQIVVVAAAAAAAAVVCTCMCWYLDNGEVFVFGDGMAGQLGLGSQSASDMLITQPTMLTSLKMHKIVALSCGDGHTAVISGT